MDKLNDEELVMFNLSLMNKDSDNIMQNLNFKGAEKINKILQELGEKVGNGTDSYMLQKGQKNTSDSGSYELWSPIMTVKEAKEKMPKLIDAMDKAHISENLAVPLKVKDVMEYMSRTPKADENIKEDMEYVYLHCMLDERNKEDWGIQSEKYKENVYKLLNQEKKEDLPPEEYGAMKFTRENILQNYNSKDCLFSGTMVSDDYFSMSKRAGRNGSLYATPNFDYAKIYDGINCRHGEVVSATGDFYHSLSADVYGKKMRIGFINVYQQNNNEDKYFTNFGLERGSVRQHSLENKTDEKAETYITEEKNPQIAKIMHIQIQGEQRWTDYF